MFSRLCNQLETQWHATQCFHFSSLILCMAIQNKASNGTAATDMNDGEKDVGEREREREAENKNAENERRNNNDVKYIFVSVELWNRIPETQRINKNVHGKATQSEREK